MNIPVVVTKEELDRLVDRIVHLQCPLVIQVVNPGLTDYYITEPYRRVATSYVNSENELVHEIFFHLEQ